jgi:hypothetical protein
LAVDQTPAWIDDRHRVAANDEPNVGYRVFVLRCDVLIDAMTDVNSLCDFLGDKRACFMRALLRESSDAAKARASE